MLLAIARVIAAVGHLSGSPGVADWLAYLEPDDATFSLRLFFVKEQVPGCRSSRWSNETWN